MSASKGDADFQALQPDLATLSSNGRHDVIEGSAIIGQQDNAAEVSAAIIDLLERHPVVVRVKDKALTP